MHIVNIYALFALRIEEGKMSIMSSQQYFVTLNTALGRYCRSFHVAPVCEKKEDIFLKIEQEVSFSCSHYAKDVSFSRRGS